MNFDNDQDKVNAMFRLAVDANLDTMIIEKNGNRLIYTRQQNVKPLKLLPVEETK